MLYQLNNGHWIAQEHVTLLYCRGNEVFIYFYDNEPLLMTCESPESAKLYRDELARAINSVRMISSQEESL